MVQYVRQNFFLCSYLFQQEILIKSNNKLKVKTTDTFLCLLSDMSNVKRKEEISGHKAVKTKNKSF